MKTYPDLSGLITFPNAKNKKRWQVAILGVLSHSFVNDFDIYIHTQRERYVKMLVADGQAPSISYRKGPMYVSIYMYKYSVEGPLIS